MQGFDLIIKPDEEDAEAAGIFVDGAIGGKRYPFLLDTGAAISAITRDDYTSAFDLIGKHRSSGVFSTDDDDLIVVPVIELGPVLKRDFTITRVTDKNPVLRNLLGMDFLKDNSYHFLFDEARVEVDPDEVAYPFLDLFLGKRFHPYVDVQLGDDIYKAVWDTGAGITVVNLDLIDKHPALFQEAGWSQGIDSGGAIVETPMYTMAAVTIGSYVFPPHRIAGVNLSGLNPEVPMNLILGYSTLCKANWLFDFPRKKWAITKIL